VEAGRSRICTIFATIKARDKAATRAIARGEFRYEIETKEILAKRSSH
jgi:hypothetical protein